MIRRLKALELTLGVVFAMGALGASGAGGTVDHFTTTTGGPALLTGASHDHVFRITNGAKTIAEFNCTTSRFGGTAVSGGTNLTVDASYTGKVNETPHGTPCSSSLGDVTVEMNGCDYDISGETTGEDPIGSFDATVWITCPGANKIQVTYAPLGVTLSIPAQTPTSGGVTYKNLVNHAGASAIEARMTATGFEYSCAPATICMLAGIPANGKTVDYTGTLVATCYEDLEGLPTPITEGKQVGCSVS
jgi:hypothetical protein